MSAPVANPAKTCLGCGQTDDHPKHVHVQPDHSETAWHMDCHARANPPCEPCTMQIKDSPGVGAAHAEELRAHIVANDPYGAHVAAQQAVTDAVPSNTTGGE